MTDSAVTDVAGLNSWVEISRRAYLHNLAFFKRLLGPSSSVAAVVKANAYGHGMLLIAGLARQGGAASFCVHSLEEALALRVAGFDEDILVMGHVPLARLDEAVAERLSCVLFNPESVERLAELASPEKPARVHLKLETGTNRQGVDGEALSWFLDFIRNHPQVSLEGVYTHFANIEDTTDHSYANRQQALFNYMVERIQGAGFADVRVHAACSAAALVVPGTRYDMVRLGISQYGLWSSKETFLSYKLQNANDAQDEGDVLRPVLTWKTRISQVKTVSAGSYVGYGCSYQTTRDSRIAILPIGYSDGYDRRLSNQAYVLVRGRRAPVRGRICMNLTMIDVTDIPGAMLEDEVVVLGRQGEQEITAEHLAGLIGTIAYEVVARISPALARLPS